LFARPRGLLVLTAGLLLACSTSVVPDLAPSSTAQFWVTVAAGTSAGVPWAINANARDGQLCLMGTIAREVDKAGTCGPVAPPPAPIFWAGMVGGTPAGSSNPVLAAGVVSDAVASVVIDMANGQTVGTTLVSLAPYLNAQAFGAALPPASAPAWFIALDQSGNELERAVGPSASTPAP
jgi:hypothetical protein